MPGRARSPISPAARPAALAVHRHAAAALEDRGRGDERLLVAVAAPHREHAAVRVDELQRRLEELRLRHERHLPADRRAEEEVVHERGVVRREDHRAARRHELGRDAAHAEQRPRVERGDDAHDLVDEVGLARARALVEAVEELGRARVAVDLRADRRQVAGALLLGGRRCGLVAHGDASVPAGRPRSRDRGRAPSTGRGYVRAHPTRRTSCRRSRPTSRAPSGRSSARSASRSTEGDTVVILESMKMEMPVEAEDAGDGQGDPLRGGPGRERGRHARRPRVGAPLARH